MRRALLLAPIALLAAAASFAPRPAGAQEGGPREVHLGAGSCAAHACHGGGADSDVSWRSAYRVWKDGKHSSAYGLLTSEAGKRMGKRLGIEPREAQMCLSCHGTTGVTTAATFDADDGVSCELCHGGAKDWLGDHATPGWKGLDRAEKAKRGMRDLSTPAKRVAACVRCHVAGEGRDITHEIMAAGHPPLSFDAAKFMHDMPPHWRDAEDKAIPTWVEGLKANARAQLDHVARAANKKEHWPEFAVFDCYACHHPVYTGSVYERADPLGKPGDLPLDLSSLRVLLRASGDEALARSVHDLVAKTYRPGDDGRSLAIFARTAAETVAGLFPDAGSYGAAEAARFLGNLDAHLARVMEGGTRTTRFEMQQIAAAIHALSPQRDTDAFRDAYAALDAELALERPYDAPTCATLARAAVAAGR
jgi:hypothetical protein